MPSPDGTSYRLLELISAVGLIVFFTGIIHAFARKELVGDNPWGVGATTLEWTLSSPPPFHQFEKLPHIV
jgi:cytochrome c oxidase subunit 1